VVNPGRERRPACSWGACPGAWSCARFTPVTTPATRGRRPAGRPRLALFIRALRMRAVIRSCGTGALSRRVAALGEQPPQLVFTHGHRGSPLPFRPAPAPGRSVSSDPQPGQGPAGLALSPCPRRAPQDAGHLGFGHVLEVAQHHHGALGPAGQGGPAAPPQGVALVDGVGLRRRGFGRSGGLAGGPFPVPPAPPPTQDTWVVTMIFPDVRLRVVVQPGPRPSQALTSAA